MRVLAAPTGHRFSVLTLTKSIDNESEVNEGQEHDVELSKREKMRRKPLRRRKRRSISLRFSYRARSYSQGSIPLVRGGTTGIKPRSSQLPGLIVFVGPIHQ